MSDRGPITAFPAQEIAAQKQEGTGLDRDMKPLAEFTRFEAWDEHGRPYLREYVGSGKLKGKSALLSGGDSGIGRAVALLMAREGADVSLVYLPQEQADADDVKAQIEKESKGQRKCELIGLDLMDRENCFKAVEAHVEAHGSLSILVNNSARQDICENLEDIDLDNVERTYRLNIFAMFALTKAALKYMKRGGVIVNSASVAATMGNPALVDYSSSKGAIVTFTRSLALQLAPKSIRVCAVAPGIIYTPLQPATGGQKPQSVEQIGVDENPGQRPGQPSEVASAYVWLASPEAGFVTGTTIHVNGGIEVGC